MTATIRTFAKFFRNSTKASAENSRLKPESGFSFDGFGLIRSSDTTVSPWTRTPKAAAATMTPITGAISQTTPQLSRSTDWPRSDNPVRPVPTSTKAASAMISLRALPSFGKSPGARKAVIRKSDRTPIRFAGSLELGTSPFFRASRSFFSVGSSVLELWSCSSAIPAP